MVAEASGGSGEAQARVALLSRSAVALQPPVLLLRPEGDVLFPQHRVHVGVTGIRKAVSGEGPGGRMLA